MASGGSTDEYAAQYSRGEYKAASQNSTSGSRPDVSEMGVLDILRRDAAEHKGMLAIIAASMIAASGFFFYSSIKALVLMAAFVGIGAVSRMWQRFLPIAFGVELVMLFTVISGIMYGQYAGLIVGFLALSISTLITQEDIAKMWPGFLTIALIGFIAGTITITNIAFWGVALTVLYDAIISIAYIAMGHSIIKTLIFDVTHIAFNYFVFFNVAPVLLSALA